MQPLQHDSVSKLIFELSKLPGIGEKTATRLSYFILKQESAYAHALADALVNAKKKAILCESCRNLTETDPCDICTDHQRDPSVLCIVEKPTDVFSIERTRAFRGMYHVLHGALSPLDGIGPEELKIQDLILRLKKNHQAIHEVIVATNPSVEGETTALYLARLIQPLGIRVTQLAHGIPVGGLLEYSDQQTIGKALQNRMEMH